VQRLLTLMATSAAVVMVAVAVSASGLRADDACPGTDKPIATDRPDVTNSSLVVPLGSFQNENGINVSTGRHFEAIDGTNSRLRYGIAHCLEVLVDVPNYVGSLHRGGHSAFGDVAPAIKWQVSPIPGTFDLSLAAGAALPTGDVSIAGRGTQPYLQAPWSYELGHGWAINGMFTSFFKPSEVGGKQLTETTFSVEKELREDLAVFVEYVGDFPQVGRNQQMINSGASWHADKLHQIDMHVAFGLNNNSPDMVVGLGYSFRIDGLGR